MKIDFDFEKYAKICYQEQKKCDAIYEQIQKLIESYHSIMGLIDKNHFKAYINAQNAEQAESENRNPTKYEFLQNYYTKKENTLISQKERYVKDAKDLQNKMEDINKTMGFGIKFDFAGDDAKKMMKSLLSNYNILQNNFVGMYRKNNLLDYFSHYQTQKFAETAKQYVIVAKDLRDINKGIQNVSRHFCMVKESYCKNFRKRYIYTEKLCNFGDKKNNESLQKKISKYDRILLEQKSSIADDSAKIGILIDELEKINLKFNFSKFGYDKCYKQTDVVETEQMLSRLREYFEWTMFSFNDIFANLLQQICKSFAAKKRANNKKHGPIKFFKQNSN